MLAARLSILIALSTVMSTGCMFYDDDDDDCEWGGRSGVEADQAPEYYAGQRDPETGTCEYFGSGGGGGGGGGCGDPCQPCDPPPEPGVEIAQPTWGYCESHCTGLDEGTCKDTEACRAIYNVDGLYLDCWQTDLTGPIQGGGCDGLGALECSRHDDCSAVHFSSCDSGDSDGGFQEPECVAEAFESCIPEDSTINPGSCDGEVLCDAPTPDCPAGSTPGIADGCYTGYCIPLDRCEDPGPGVCYGEVTCEVTPPSCPDGTLPGIADGCYTGYCIPMNQCEAQPACNEIVAEATCVGRPDCTPLYEGVDCVCDADGCVCAEWTFDSCE